ASTSRERGTRPVLAGVPPGAISSTLGLGGAVDAVSRLRDGIVQRWRQGGERCADTDGRGSLGRVVARGAGAGQAGQRSLRGPVLVSLPVRGGLWHEPRGADRGRPCGVL